jgi:hypothetical protein
VALTCLVEGITPLEFKRTYHLIQGSPSMRADAMLATFRTKYGGKHRIVERSTELAAIELTNKDGDTASFSFSWEEAQASRWPWKDPDNHDKGIKDNWSTPTDRKAMLWARLVSDSIRAFQPEVVSGVYTPEELEDANVVSTQITTNGASRPTAAEVLASASVEAQPAEATAVDDADDDEDAQFEPAANEPLGEGYATRGQIDKILGLVTELQAPLDQALAKRGVNAMHSLTVDQAKELIDKLESRKQQLAGASSGN